MIGLIVHLSPRMRSHFSAVWKNNQRFVSPSIRRPTINSAVNTGDYAEAERAARTAKIWIIVSAVVGVLVNIVFVIMTYAGIFGSYYYYY